MLFRWTVFFIFWTSSLCVQAQDPDWPQWRGPDFNGSSPATGLPEVWSVTANISWKVPMPGAAGATPIIWKDHVFVTSLDNETKDLIAFCIKRSSGEVLWKKVLGIGFGDEGRGRNMASPSPVTDGERVIFLFGSTDLVALDFQGNILWSRNLKQDYGEFNVLFGYHSSPLLYQGKLYVQVLQRDHPLDGPAVEGSPIESFLLALDPATGRELFRHVRPTDAVEESHESYATPIPFIHNGRAEILLFGGDCVSGHNPETGVEYWRWGSWNPTKINHWRVVPSPVTSEGLVHVCAPKGNPVFAIKAGGQGQLGDDAVVWHLDKNTSDVCVPLVYQDRIYVLDGDKKALTCMEVKTGVVKWIERLRGDGVFRGSPTGADGRVYLINEEGEVIVLAASDEFKVLARFSMGEPPCRSSISVAGKQLFVRTGQNLYCVEK
jgi:outer membrane protein assembly factor BamB